MTIMTIPVLRPPRTSPATAYLKHLQKKKRTDVVGDCEDCNNNQNLNYPQKQSSSCEHEQLKNAMSSTTPFETQHPLPPLLSSSNKTRKSSKVPKECTSDSHPPKIPSKASLDPTKSLTTQATYVSSSSDEETREGPASDASLSRNDGSNNSLSTGDFDPQLSANAWSSPQPVSTPVTQQCSDTQRENAGSELEVLIAETSRRWKETARSNHSRFCRDPACHCRAATASTSSCETPTLGNQLSTPVGPLRPALQTAMIPLFPTPASLPSNSLPSQMARSPHDLIRQQEAEIAALRARLELNCQQQNNANTNQVWYSTEQDEDFCDYDYETVDDILPVEQIEVYHDEDHVSVTSGLTQLYPVAGDDMGSICLHAPSRPDAESVCESYLHLQQAKKQQRDQAQPAETDRNANNNNTPTMLTLRSGDGTTVRQALYTGPFINGQATGYGTLLFVETGDSYEGDIVNGQMSGRGAYTFNTANNKAVSSRSRRRVLKGRFERNVFLGGAGL